jgi:hypothetical protein
MLQSQLWEDKLPARSWSRMLLVTLAVLGAAARGEQ